MEFCFSYELYVVVVGVDVVGCLLDFIPVSTQIMCNFK